MAHEPRVDRDFALLIQEWAILPGSTIPNTMSMEFNLFSINGRAAPYVTPLVCKLGERVRIRLVNFGAIDHHPMHLHGVTFFVTGTEGGGSSPRRGSRGTPSWSAVAQVREIEFIANNPGDWMLHCHMFHHVMNFMSSMVGPMGGHTVQGMRAGQARRGRHGDGQWRAGALGCLRPQHGAGHGRADQPGAQPSAPAHGRSARPWAASMPGMAMPIGGHGHGHGGARHAVCRATRKG